MVILPAKQKTGQDFIIEVEVQYKLLKEKVLFGFLVLLFSITDKYLVHHIAVIHR